MEYHVLLDLATEVGYRLAMCGAETFRVEESINRILQSYGISSEVFAIPNCLHVSIVTSDGQSFTRMRRIEDHGNDLDGVEHYSALCRKICAQKPDPQTAMQWLRDIDSNRVHYSPAIYLLGNFLGAFGFCILFGGTLIDALCSGVCGFLIGLITRWMDRLKANQFFRLIAASFVMALLAYGMGLFGIANNSDTIIIGALMILVPGLLFTNAMRDIIFGDINSGINRIVQVFLIAVALALGTGVAWTVAAQLFGAPVTAQALNPPLWLECVACFFGCLGFAIIFNIHGPGSLICTLGGVLTWAVYAISLECGFSDIVSYFAGAFFASAFSETMARIRKYPAISYLVVSVFPLIPGAGIYYTMNHAVRGDMTNFTQQGMHTIGIAGAMAVGILLVSTVFRLYSTWKTTRKLS